ncbi:MAG: pyruvate dehydrogenase (acetyl-transferring) E1 component subunit alpha [Candidatus Woesearchaeota archaeon]
MDEHGNLDPSTDPHLTEDLKKQMYHLMVLIRRMDEKLFALQRQGKIGTYAPVKGQEAAQVGTAMLLQKNDWVVPSFREMGVGLVKGMDRAHMVNAWNGDTRAFSGSRELRMLPTSIPVGSQMLHACGIAWAAKLRGEKDVAATYFGDGATSEGDFHEAMNFAGVFKLPVIFVCQNNQWAISTPRLKQTAAETLAQKAIAYGMPSMQVDGNDVLAVYSAMKEAVERARNGEGATFLELLTYRLADHTTSDDASKYRNPDEVTQWESRDPILRLKKFFEKNNMWTEEYGNWVNSEVEKEVADAVERGLAFDKPGPNEVFDHIYAELPADIKKQEEECIRRGAK